MVSFVLCPRTNENEADCPCCMQHNKVERQYMKDMNTLAEIIEAKDAEIKAMQAVVEAAKALEALKK